MTSHDLPLPSGGGSWIRDPETGALTPVPDIEAAAPVTDLPVPADPPPAKGRKTTEKEA